METYGDLKNLINLIKTQKKNSKIKGVALDAIIGNIPGIGYVKSAFDFYKAAIKTPDSKRPDSWLSKLDVDDEMSAIVDDKVENGFLQSATKTFEKQPDDKILNPDFDMNKEMIKYLGSKYSGRTLTGVPSFDLVKEDVLDKFLKQYSYKFDKGYPDMDNPKDKKMLLEFAYKLTEKKTILNEGEKEYDDVIKKALGVDEIPISKNQYPFPGSGGSTFNIQVKSDDLDIWQKLWTAKPKKKTGDKTETLGVGKGELSLYWLYNYSDSGVTVTEGRDGDDPDLRFDGTGVEVKAYSKHSGKNNIGRFGADRENLKVLSVIFGIDALAQVLDPDTKPRTTNPTNFTGDDLKNAMDQLMYLSSINLSELGSKYPIFKSIEANIDLVQKELEGFDNPEEGAIKMAKKMLTDKLGRKPGNGGFLANVMLNGDCKFFSIILDKLSTPEVLNNISVKQSSLGLDFEKTFG